MRKYDGNEYNYEIYFDFFASILIRGTAGSQHKPDEL
jgi:hypothetical protein